ncbi:unnamed protein product [Polarella glacialis]|uniref:Uncharacterized protein n=1 Tax=Polarella glacialis TaxID=89957 RepID=A0A813JQB5_POLGL|nr:unnamed protein product [Polarella glacialis]
MAAKSSNRIYYNSSTYHNNNKNNRSSRGGSYCSRRRWWLVLLALLGAAAWQCIRATAQPAVTQFRFGFRRASQARLQKSSAGALQAEHVKARLLQDIPVSKSSSSTQQRAADFTERVKALAREALSWPQLPDWQRLEWAAALLLDAVPVRELPPWFLEQHNVTRRDIGVDLLSLDGNRAVQCKWYNGPVPSRQIRHFLRVSRWIFKARECVLLTSKTSKLTQSSLELLRDVDARHQITTSRDIKKLMARPGSSATASISGSVSALRPCQEACLAACQNGARIIEMACGTGKTRVMRELADRAEGRVLVLVPSLLLLGQFAKLFSSFCLVGTHFNDKIDYDAEGFISVYDSVHLLANITFSDIFVDEAHHLLPLGCPSANNIYRFSATQHVRPEFEYSMGKAIDDGVLCEYDIIIPIITQNDTQACLAEMLQKQAGHFRRVLAYCNTIAEACSFQEAVEAVGLSCWHINGDTPSSERAKVISDFSGPLLKPAHVLVTVQVLGEGVDIPNADTCLFVEPRSSYVSIIQAVGRVLRQHPTKPLAHIILPGFKSSLRRERKKNISRTEEEHLSRTAEPRPSKPRAVCRRPPQCEKGELERFMLALSHADGRLKDSFRGRVRYMVAGDDAGTEWSPLSSIRSARDQVSECLCSSAYWETRVHELQEFVSLQQRLPMQKAQDDHERSLAHFVKNIGTAMRSGRLSWQQSRSLAGCHPLVSQQVDRWADPDARWNERFDDLALFVKDKGRIPSYGASGKVEDSLSLWFKTQLSQLADGCLELHKINALNSTHPSVAEQISMCLLGPLAGWKSRLRECTTFTHSHGKLPGRTDSEGGAKSLCEWLSYQRKCLSSLSDEKVQLLQSSHPLLAQRVQSWRDPMHRFQSCCEDLSVFIKHHNRLPSSVSVEDSEKSLGFWIANQLSRSNGLSKQQLLLLRRCHPLMDERLSKQLDKLFGNLTTFQDRCQEVALFIQQADRCPILNVSNRHESRLARTLDVWYKSLHNLPPNYTDILRSIHPSMACKIDQQQLSPLKAFKQKCKLLREFVIKHQRCPRPVRSIFVAERRLGQWLGSHKPNFQSLTQVELACLRKTHRIVAEKLEKWENPISSWRSTCQRLKEFIITFGRTPRASEKDAEHVALAQWIASQSQTYRAGRLDPDQVMELRSTHELLAERVDGWQRRYRPDERREERTASSDIGQTHRSVVPVAKIKSLITVQQNWLFNSSLTGLQ